MPIHQVIFEQINPLSFEKISSVLKDARRFLCDGLRANFLRWGLKEVSRNLDRIRKNLDGSDERRFR